MQPTNGFAWFIAAVKRYVVLSGRARRREFWYFLLFYELSYLVAAVIGNFLGTQFLSYVVTFGLALPSIGVMVRRLHDTNRSGWWSLLPIVNLVFCAQDSDPSENRFGLCPKPISELQSRDSVKPSVSIDNIVQIEKLAALRDKGVLTEEEFQTRKTEIL